MSERFRGFQEFMGEVLAQTMGKLGIALIVFLVAASAYALIVLPPDFAERWTHGIAYWEVNPPLAEPEWVRFFGVPVAPHVVEVFREPSEEGLGVFNLTVPGTGTIILRAGYIQNYTLTYKLRDPAFPKGIIVKFLEVKAPGDVSIQVTPYLLVKRPDGVTFLVNRPETLKLDEIADRTIRVDTPTLIDQFTGVYGVPRERLQGIGAMMVFMRFEEAEAKPLVGEYEVELVLIYTAPGVPARELRKLFEEGYGVKELLIVVQGSAYGLMGTDDKGRDIYLGLLYGFPIALLIGFFAAVSSVVIGLIAGVVSGYYGRWIDETIQRTVDVIGNIPLLPILVIIGVALQEMDVNPWYRLFTIIGVIVVLGWGGLAIIVRSMTLSIKAEPYIDAAKALGASNARIIFRHIVPQIIPYAMATLVFSVPTAILIEAGLSVLGIHHGLPTWGRMLADARAYVGSGGSYGVWWWILPPGILIAVTSLAFVLLGLALETVVEPRLRRR
jgi:ABC-type dipeptide/oligopeptide/nickel transport system permease subunit